MHIISEATNDGVDERLFELEVAGDRVPGVFWVPAGASGSRPLVLMGHGGSQHKKVEPLVARARRYVRHLGFAVAGALTMIVLLRTVERASWPGAIALALGSTAAVVWLFGHMLGMVLPRGPWGW